MEKISKHVGYITKDKCFKKRLESVAKRRLSGPEKTFASMINTAGRKAYFDEHRIKDYETEQQAFFAEFKKAYLDIVKQYMYIDCIEI